MRKLIQKLFRYKLVSIYFVVSQIVIFTAIFGALRIYNKAYAKEKDRLRAIAKTRIEMTVDSFSETDLLSVAGLEVEAGNVVADGKLSVELKDSKFRCEMYLTINEDIFYPMTEGHIPGTELSDFNENCVAVGRDKCKYIYEKNGEKYMTINQEEYRVVGIIGSKTSDYWDYKIVLNIKCISDNLRQSLKAPGKYTINLYSNKTELMDSYKKVYENLINADRLCSITSNKINNTGESTFANTLQKENFKTNALVYLFCLINSVIISMFWVIQRRTELAIRRTLGMSTFRIVIEMAKDIAILMLISFVIFVICYVSLGMINYKSSGKLDSWDFTYVLSVLVLSVITFLVTLVYPAVDVYKNSREIIR